MKSVDYDSQELTFGNNHRLGPVQLVRAALLNGLFKLHGEGTDDILKQVSSNVWLKYIEKYSNVDKVLTEWIFQFPDQARSTGAFSKLEEQLDPVLSKSWKRFNYDDLAFTGVLRRTDSYVDMLMAAEYSDKHEHEIVLLDSPFTEQRTDYRKHISPRNKIRISTPNETLDGQKSIRSFLESKGESFPLDKDRDLFFYLRDLEYDFPNAWIAALKSADTSQNQVVIEYQNVTTSDPVRIFPLQWIQGLEHYIYYENFGKNIEKNEIIGEKSYAGNVVAITKKRNPSDKFEYNLVTLENMPDFRSKKPIDPIWWMNFRTDSTDIYSKNRSSWIRMVDEEKDNKPVIIGAHPWSVFLSHLTEEKRDPRRYVPIPSEKLMRSADYFRYNVLVDTEPGRRRLNQDEINIGLLALMKRDPEGAFMKPGSGPIYDVLKPLVV